MKDYVKTSCCLALSLLAVSAMPLQALADTVKVNVHLEGKTRYPKTNRWMGVLEVQAGDRKSLYTVQADQAGTTITFDVPAGAPFSLKEACKLHGYDLGRIERDGDIWNVTYVGDGKGSISTCGTTMRRRLTAFPA